MALTDINSALGTTFAKKLTRVWNRSSVLLQNMTVVPGGGQGGGKHVGWDVQFGGATADTFAEGADISSFTNDLEVPATLPWGQYQSAFKLTNKEMNAAYANMGNAQELEKILEERMFDAITAITSKINTDIVVGTGTGTGGNPTIIGLLTSLLDSGSYAGINPATAGQGAWVGNLQANGGVARPLTLELLATAETLQYVASGQSSDVIVTTPNVKKKYEGLFNATQRMNAGAGGPIARMDASAEDLYWRGRQVLREKDMTAGYLLGLNSQEIELCVLPWAPVPDAVPTQLKQLISSDGDNSRLLGAMVNVYPLARTGSAVKFAVEIYCQLKVRRRNQHFMIKDISET
jgi:hypothetical protein